MEPKQPDFDYKSFVYNGEIIGEEDLTENQIKQLKNYLSFFKKLEKGKIV